MSPARSVPRASALRARAQLDAVEVEAGRQLEVVGGEQLGVAQDLAAGAVGHDRPRGEDHGALAELGGERQVVGRHQHRAVDAREHVEQLAARARVEVGRRLVEHEQARAHRQHGGDRHPPALAHRELVGGALGRRAPCAPRRAPRATRSRDLVALEAHVERAERHVLLDGGHEELVVGVLEHEARRARRSSASVVGPTRRPPPRARRCRAVRPFRWSISVVLPAPFGPSSATRSPWLDVQVHAVAAPAARSGSCKRSPTAWIAQLTPTTPAATRSGTRPRSTATTKSGVGAAQHERRRAAASRRS